MNRISVVLPLILVSTSLGAVGQTLIKLAINRLEGVKGVAGVLLALLADASFWAGGLMVTAGTLTWLYILSRAHLTYATPFLGIGMVLTMGTSAVILHEPLVPARIIGTLVVAIGVALVARS